MDAETVAMICGRGKTVLETIWWNIWLFIGIGLSVTFIVMVPRRLLRCLSAYPYPVRDRGIAQCNLGKGISVLFTPSVAVQPYLRQYQVCQFNASETKKFYGEWARPLSEVVYSLIAYDRHDRCIGIVRIWERTEGKRFTAVTNLPRRTDYVSVRIHRADGTRIRMRPQPLAFFGWLTLLLASIALAVDALVWFGIVIALSFFPPIASATYWAELGVFLLMIAAAIVIVPLVVAGIAYALSFRTRKKKSRKSCRLARWQGSSLRKAWIKFTCLWGKAACLLSNAGHAVAWSAPVRIFRPYAGNAPRACKPMNANASGGTRSVRAADPLRAYASDRASAQTQTEQAGARGPSGGEGTHGNA